LFFALAAWPQLPRADVPSCSKNFSWMALSARAIAVYPQTFGAASPTSLRRCNPGELGVVLSRYHHIAGYELGCCPRLAYLTLSKSRRNPSICGLQARLFLRNQYRRQHFATLVPDPPSSDPDSGDWYQLAGSAYDRTLYGFQLPTSPER